VTSRRLVAAAAVATALAAPPSASAGFGFLGDFGTPGEAPGQFRSPSAVDVDPAGNVWVIDYYPHRVQKLSAAGEPLLTLRGSSEVQAIAVDGAGNVYVGDQNGDVRQILRYSSDGAPLGAIGGPGSGPGQFQAICGLDADGAGNVYVADGSFNYCGSPARIQKFDPAGNFVKSWDPRTAPASAGSTGDIAVDDAGNLYMADGDREQILKFTTDGAFVAKWGGSGSADGKFGANSPSGLAVDPAGNVYALDPGNKRVQKFAPDGTFLARFGASHFSGIGSSPNGEIYVSYRDSFNDDARQVLQEFRSIVGDRIRRFGEGAPPGVPGDFSMKPGAKITLGGPAKDACGKQDRFGHKILNCLGYRSATFEWSAGCNAPGPLARRSWNVLVANSAPNVRDGFYKPLVPTSPSMLEVHRVAADGGSERLILGPGTKVKPRIDAACIGYTQPDGVPVTAEAQGIGDAVLVPPTAFVGRIEYSRSARGRLLGNNLGKKAKPKALHRGAEIRMYWFAGYDESLAPKPRQVQVHIKGAGLKVTDYLHPFHLEDGFGPRLVVRPKKKGVIKVWTSAAGVRSINTVTLRVK
jgi:sugar lactone lactonase YvrE